LFFFLVFFFFKYLVFFFLCIFKKISFLIYKDIFVLFKKIYGHFYLFVDLKGTLAFFDSLKENINTIDNLVGGNINN
jgi:hypothetical protein